MGPKTLDFDALGMLIGGTVQSTRAHNMDMTSSPGASVRFQTLSRLAAADIRRLCIVLF